jgi:hypothetical protein
LESQTGLIEKIISKTKKGVSSSSSSNKLTPLFMGLNFNNEIEIE